MVESNGDGMVTASDAVAVLQFVAGIHIPTDTQAITSNVNSDASITAFDAVLILQHVAGMNTGYSIGEP